MHINIGYKLGKDYKLKYRAAQINTYIRLLLRLLKQSSVNTKKSVKGKASSPENSTANRL